MKIIDVHHHLVCEADYPERLLREMDRLNIEKTGLMALGPLFERLFLRGEFSNGPLAEEDLQAALRHHPDRFFGYVFIHLGLDGLAKAKEWHERGFQGLKFHIPKAPYDHEDYFPIYEYAERHDLPCIFHSGVFNLPSMRGQRIKARYTSPEYIEPIANEFPDLKIIIAHLGTFWAEIVCSLIRIYPNVYADMSSRVDGWKSSKPKSWWQEMLYWPEAHRKLLFGSDVHFCELPQVVEDQYRIVRDYLEWSPPQVEGFFSANARRLFAWR